MSIKEKMLPKSYQNQLKSQVDERTYLLIEIVINLLQAVKTVNLEKLATFLPMPILFESRRRKIQRFLKLPGLTIENLWVPLIKIWIESELGQNKIYYLVIDRTNWGEINLLFVSLAWGKRGIPIYVMRLPKKGSSNLQEQQAILTKVFPIFAKHQICVLGDREFCGVGLASWINQQGMLLALRLKRSHYIHQENEFDIPLSALELNPGTSLFFEGVKITKSRNFNSFNLAAKWSKKIRNKQPKEGWFILTNLPTCRAAMSAYSHRFTIEEMFRDFKSGGYNIENINVEDCRFIPLILLVFIAYFTAIINGQTIKHQGCQKYLGRVDEPNRKTRRHSSFYLGLYGLDWLGATSPITNLLHQLVGELMRLNPNKALYYRRGEHAITLIQSRL
jgi:hypothetical protein